MPGVGDHSETKGRRFDATRLRLPSGGVSLVLGRETNPNIGAIHTPIASSSRARRLRVERANQVALQRYSVAMQYADYDPSDHNLLSL